MAFATASDVPAGVPNQTSSFFVLCRWPIYHTCIHIGPGGCTAHASLLESTRSNACPIRPLFRSRHGTVYRWSACRRSLEDATAPGL
eukprot:360626-Chlamydomonas_euryale.AAC.2